MSQKGAPHGAPFSFWRSKIKTRTRAGVICIRDAQMLVIELEDPVTKARYLSLPGGGIEDGETPAIAAAREALEETGYSVTLNEASQRIHEYVFVWAGESYACTTHWFMATTGPDEPAQVDDAPFNLGPSWIPVQEVAGALTYHEGTRDLALDMIRQHV